MKEIFEDQENTVTTRCCNAIFVMVSMVSNRLGLIWSKLSDQKNSETTFAFLNGDYKNAFSFFLLLQKARSQRVEVYKVTLLKRKPHKIKIFNNFVKNSSIFKFSKLGSPYHLATCPEANKQDIFDL